MDPADMIVKLLVIVIPSLVLAGRIVFTWWLYRISRRGAGQDGPLGARERVGSPR